MAGAFYGKQLNHPKYLIKPNQFTEIERKFLLDSFPTDLPLKEEFQVYQAYLSINPEVRIRRNEKDGKDTAYYLAIKSSGEMIRKEVEIPISKDYFYALVEMVSQPFITKDFRTACCWNALTSIKAEIRSSCMQRWNFRACWPQKRLSLFLTLRRMSPVTLPIR